MQEIIIAKKIEQEVETIFLHAKALADMRDKYPQAVFTILNEFQLQQFQDRDFIQDDFNNIKVKMYTEVVRSMKIQRIKKEKERIKLAKKLK